MTEWYENDRKRILLKLLDVRYAFPAEMPTTGPLYALLDEFLEQGLIGHAGGGRYQITNAGRKEAAKYLTDV